MNGGGHEGPQTEGWKRGEGQTDKTVRDKRQKFSLFNIRYITIHHCLSYNFVLKALHQTRDINPLLNFHSYHYCRATILVRPSLSSVLSDDNVVNKHQHMLVHRKQTASVQNILCLVATAFPSRGGILWSVRTYMPSHHWQLKVVIGHVNITNSVQLLLGITLY